MQRDSNIFNYSSFKCGYLDYRSEYRKSLVLLIDACAAISFLPRHSIPEKFNRVTLGRLSLYRFLALHKRKSRKIIFLSKTIFIKLSTPVWFGRVFLKLAGIRIVFRRASAKVGSIVNYARILPFLGSF